ncbi:tetratricopeptide repeat protein [Gillisia sp. Hel_I_86]|uniref:tetratricopeptide repeat protein n=1 Tax=Gillisia sp. Hel_I_86 TaxID=1249981 RepID=UPI0011A5ED11|nr:tetratricopeptide repeat protein [Gillisia sp. Hel_I_86]
MLEDQDLDAAKKVFEAQIAEYSKEANPYDSYADLLLEMGNKEEAKKNLKKSVELAEKGTTDLDEQIFNQGNNPVGKRIVVYDAMEDRYDMAFINPTDPLGINVSYIKVKDLGNNKVELMETYVDRKGKDRKVRHEVMKNSNNSIEWVVFQQEDGSDKWGKATVQNYNKSM